MDDVTFAVNRAAAREAFLRYVEPYDMDDPKIALKVAHTLRVAELCERIAREEGFTPAGQDLGWLCGLLHDIGRFEQVRRWGTYRDAASASHPALGVDVLFEGAGRLTDPGFVHVEVTDPAVLACDPTFFEHARTRGSIRNFIADDALDPLIRTAVGEHGAFRLPEGLDVRTRAFCDLVRDADKLDILRLPSRDDPETVLGATRDELLDSRISPAAEEAFYAHRTVRNEERLTPLDGMISRACFAYELVYPASLAIADEEGHLYETLERPFGITEPYRDPATRFEVSRMSGHLRAWVDERLG